MLLRLIPAVLWLVTIGPLIAQAAECLPVAPRQPEGNYIVPGVIGEIVYRRLGDRDLALDAYIQPGRGRHPAVIVVHGGHWESGSRVAHIGQLLELLTAAGYNWFSIDYRLGGIARYEEMLGDLRAALSFVRCRAAELQTDPQRLALLGEDSGAHLVALLAAEKPAGVKAVVGLGGFYQLTEISSLKGKADHSLLERASAARHASKGMPDLFLIHGERDAEAPPAQAEAFCERVRAAGSRCDAMQIEGAIHRSENWPPHQWSYKSLLIIWLAERLGAESAGEYLTGGRLRKDIVYDRVLDLKLDAYVPAGRGPHPAVIIVHGGGWEAGDKVTYVTPLFAPLARAGFAWFSINYRLTPQVRHPEQLADLRAAIRFVRERAREFQIDPRRLALLGESASGQMVAQIATEKDPGIAAVVSFYGVYDFLALTGEVRTSPLLSRLFGASTIDEATRALARRYSPLQQAHRGMPPLLLIHGTNERLWAQGEMMRKRLAEVGAPHELIAVEGAPHGLENWEGRPEWLSYQPRLVAWLKAQLGK